MLARQLIWPLLLFVLASILYIDQYKIDETQSVRGEQPDKFDLFSVEPPVDIDYFLDSEADIDERQLAIEPSSDNTEKPSITTKRIEVFGRIVDEYNQPIEGVLVSEDRYLFNTRSDSRGHYRLSFELPKHRLPLLNFLRTGYGGERVAISSRELASSPVLELDVTLIQTSESVTINGWISNEIGASLPGQKIRIASWGYQGQESINHTVTSDEKGEFVFEAVKPDIVYQLEVYTLPDYAPYSIQELLLTRTTPRLNITLKPLEFIQVSGMFVDIDGAPVPSFEIDLINITTGAHVRKIVSDSSGFFSIENFPTGKVKLTSRAPQIFNIIGLILNDNEYRNLILRVDRGNHQISGWISDQNGVAVNRAMVTVEAELASFGLSSISYRSTVTDDTGYFRFEQLGDTLHQVKIYARGFDKKELLHRFESPVNELHISLSRQY